MQKNSKKKTITKHCITLFVCNAFLVHDESLEDDEGGHLDVCCKETYNTEYLQPHEITDQMWIFTQKLRNAVKKNK